MSATLSNAFHSQMTASQGAGTFYAALSGRIYHGQAVENATLPLAVWTEVEGLVDANFGGKVRVRKTVEVETFYDKSAGIAAVQETDDKLFSAVDQTIVGSVTGFDRATIQCIERGVPVVLEDAISVRSRFTVEGFTT